MRRVVLFLLSLLALPSTASATWSVIAVDTSTGRVVIASATCVNRDDAFLMGVQAVVVPGKGVAACQAGVDNTHTNQMLVFTRAAEGHRSGADHRAAVARIRRFRSRQFGIRRSAGPQRRTLGADERLRLAGHPGPRAGHADLLLDSGQHPSARRSRAERGEGVPRRDGRDHRSRDGGDGSGRRDRAATVAAPARRRRPMDRRRRFRAPRRRRTSRTS